MKEYKVDVYVHIGGYVFAESDSDSDILDALFPDGWEGEVYGVDGKIEPTGVKDIDDDEED